ncbi:MAG: hypothetical protein ACF8PN_05780 [Phycisphaerales bacterium]
MCAEYLFPDGGRRERRVRSISDDAQGRPWYRIEGRFIMPERGHPCGPTGDAWFRIEGDWIYPTALHPERNDALTPWYEISLDHLYRAEGHPLGRSHRPVFRISSDEQSFERSERESDRVNSRRVER